MKSEIPKYLNLASKIIKAAKVLIDEPKPKKKPTMITKGTKKV